MGWEINGSEDVHSFPASNFFGSHFGAQLTTWGSQVQDSSGEALLPRTLCCISSPVTKLLPVRTPNTPAPAHDSFGLKPQNIVPE